MKNLILTVLAGSLGLLAGGFSTGSQPGDSIATTQEIMKQKLGISQRVLEGLATENFQLIVTSASKLKTLSQQDAWNARNTPEYQQFTGDFRRHAEALIQAAKLTNIDAASVAYFQLTLSCVNCHKYIRNSRVASLPFPRVSNASVGD
jgi:cytochrome c556